MYISKSDKRKLWLKESKKREIERDPESEK